MINKNRIALMARLEMIEQNNKKELETNDYYRKEYVVSHFLVVWLYITIFFAIMAGGAAVLFIEEYPKQAQTADWTFMIVSGLMIYALVVAIYIFLSLVIFSVRYGRSQQKVKQYAGLMRQLGAMYEREDEGVKNRAPAPAASKKARIKTAKKEKGGRT
ncbi:MAG: hypothetical protein II688_05620 [Lachnospiraceae bacterium]|nr:hypothetical protein [Lachnospiraceae bacterium]MBQ3968148.1 hypothetical protein [Lachnospiraceae bacterium]